MNDLLVHPETRAQLESFKSSPGHALMLTGRTGAGKGKIAERLVEELLGESIQTHPYILRISPKSQTITIDQIRELQNFIKLKTTGKKLLRRAVVIEDAHLMGVEAQNALLKTLEEPPHDTVLVLTAEQDVRLKPTIYSRVQRINVRPLAKEHIESLRDQYQADAFDKAYMLSNGYAGLLQALLDERQEHELVRAVESAKQVLTATVFERLAMIEEITKSKADISILLGALKRVASAAVRGAIAKGDSETQSRWQRSIRAIHEAETQLSSNGQTKLVLTNLFLSM